MKEKISLIFSRILKDIKALSIGIGAYLVYRFFTLKLWGSSCPMVLLCGIPCPGCGLTRAFKYFFSFQFSNAFQINATVFIWIPFLIWIFICRYILNKNYRFTDFIFVFFILVSLFYYTYMMIEWYPNRIPYVHTNRNLMHYTLNLLLK